MWEKTIGAGLLAGVLLGDLVLAGVVSIFFAIISAGYQYKDARNEGDDDYNWVDSMLALLSSIGAGYIGFFGADFFGVTGMPVLVVVGLMAIAGFKGLRAIIDILLVGFRQKMSNENTTRNTYNTTNNNTKETPPRTNEWMDEE